MNLQLQQGLFLQQKNPVAGESHPDFQLYRVFNIEVCFLKVLKNIANKFFFVNTWAYFQENIGHFNINALPFRKIKRKWKKFSFEKKIFKKFQKKNFFSNETFFPFPFNFSQS